MTTRWFVEVSPVDADTLKERYCVEAVQWQQALQQARKLRGDRGPFSRFNIELLDLGYRATDPAAKLRYMVSKAPEDAPLSGGFVANGARQSSKPPAGRSKIPLPKTQSRPPEAGSPRASRPPIDPAAPMSIAVLAQTGAVAPPTAPPPQPKTAAIGHSAHPVLSPPRPSSAAVAREPSHLDVSEPARTEDSAIHVVEPIPLVTPHASKAPERPGVPANPAPPSSPAPTEETVPSLPGLELIAFRREEPTEAIPIAYREFSFAVAPGLSARELERYARAAWEQVRTSLSHRPDGKFVQIAIFDHHFSARPERPPLAVLGWKDWRGDPVVQIRRSEVAARGPHSASRPGVSGPVSDEKPSLSVPRPSEGGAAHPALRPFDADTALSMRSPGRVGTAASIEPPVISTTDTSEERAFPLVAAPVSIPVAPEAIVVSVAPEPAPAPPEPLSFTAPVIAEAAPAATSARPIVIEAPVPSEGTFPNVTGSVAPSVPSKRPPLAPLRGKKPAARLGSSPRAAGRAGPHDDLISDLFDDMHQLHFMPDLKSGAEFVLTVLRRMLPSEGAIIHVFDINAREFAIVRALGPKPGNVLLIRTPDTFPLFRDAFRRGRTMRFADAQEEEGFRGGRWELLGVTANVTAVGPVHQGGRYLGLIELANPERGDPFYDTELNAIDYICQQFATFVASKPIVLEEDAILP
ncbi:MAG TPA: GAF domain-containing protein [Polyangiaceae bacterium]|jgi:hypothetical protein|nr:GAF domain-containing protein [Polyangiaceae bacterium]